MAFECVLCWLCCLMKSVYTVKLCYKIGTLTSTTLRYLAERSSVEIIRHLLSYRRFSQWRGKKFCGEHTASTVLQTVQPMARQEVLWRTYGIYCPTDGSANGEASISPKCGNLCTVCPFVSTHNHQQYG